MVTTPPSRVLIMPCSVTGWALEGSQAPLQAKPESWPGEGQEWEPRPTGSRGGEPRIYAAGMILGWILPGGTLIIRSPPRSFISVRSFPKVRDPITVLAGLIKNKTCDKKAMFHFPSRWEGEALSGTFVGRCHWGRGVVTTLDLSAIQETLTLCFRDISKGIAMVECKGSGTWVL